MPALVEELGASPLAVSWLLTAYLVSASVATPLIGRLGDLLGRGRVLTAVMALFCAGSVLCAVGDSLGLLVVGRVLQGVAGGVFPLAYGVIRDTFPAATRTRAMGHMSVSLGVGAALGPGLAGVIVDSAGPTAIFWVGMLGALPALGAAWLIPGSPVKGGARVDWLGALLLGGWLAPLVVLMTQGQKLGWTSGAALALAATALALFFTWLAVEDRLPAPLVNPAMLRGRTVALANGAAFCVGFGMFMAYVPLAPIAQAPHSTGYGFGWSVAAAGALLVPHGLVQIAVGPTAGSLCGSIGSRSTLAIGTAINSVTMLALALMPPEPGTLVVAGALLGVGQALALTAMASLVVDAVLPDVVGIATGVNAVMRTVGMSVGSAIGAAILATSLLPGSLFPSEHAYHVTFAVAAVATAGAVACAALLPSERRSPALAGEGAA